MTATPSPNTVTSERAEDIAIDLDNVAAAIRVAMDLPWQHVPNADFDKGVSIIARAIQSAQTKGDHFLSYFERLAREHPAANTALSLAKREWEMRRTA